MNKVIDSVISIDTYEKQCVVLKGMLQSPRLKDHVQTIGIDQSLSNNATNEHKCLENIKKKTGICDNRQQFKYILEATMVYTPEGFTDNSPISPIKSTPIQKPNAQKSLCLFNECFEVKKAACR